MKTVVLCMIAITLFPVAVRAQEMVPVPDAPPWMPGRPPAPNDDARTLRDGGIVITALGGGLALGGYVYAIFELVNDLSYGLFSDHQLDPNFGATTAGLIVSGLAVGGIGATMIIIGHKRMNRRRQK